MATAEPTTTQLEPRDAAALTEKMTVLDDAPGVTGAPGLFLVVTESGRSYRVDVRQGACECDDAFYRDPDGGCKHVRRVQYAINQKHIPEWANESRIDPQLGAALVEAES